MRVIRFLILLSSVLAVITSCENAKTIKSDIQSAGLSMQASGRLDSTTVNVWLNPVENHHFIITGQGWESNVFSKPFQRLPASAKESVRAAVWNLAEESAGISINFTSNASDITVRYGVDRPLQLNHMPATGVSGLDMYAYDGDMNPVWLRSKRTFKDTIEYEFNELSGLPENGDGFKRFQLYLPLYNTVKWMEIKCKNGGLADPIGFENKPIVVYGGSKSQGAVASRPGMAWTSILQRAINVPIVNLGFSGNSKMEYELVELVSQIDASMYVVDCLGNMINETEFPDSVLADRIRHTYTGLRQAHADIPILFSQHPGLGDEGYAPTAKQVIDRVNHIMTTVIAELQREGATRLYMISKEEQRLCPECTVDGTHPADLGMIGFAAGYEEVVRNIFREIGGVALKPE